MNLEYLKKNVGHRVQLQPIACCLDERGHELEPMDDKWIINSVDAEGLRISNTRTNHVALLGKDHVHHYTSNPHDSEGGPRHGFLTLNVQVYIQKNKLWVRPNCGPGQPVRPAVKDEQPRPVRIQRIKENIPKHLLRLTSGQDIMKIVADSHGFSFDHDEPQSDREMELISEFLQETQDWGDLSGDLEAGDRVKAAYRMSALLRELEEAGFWVFGGREAQRLDGGVYPPSAFQVAILKVMRSTNPEIIKKVSGVR